MAITAKLFISDIYEDPSCVSVVDPENAHINLKTRHVITAAKIKF